MILVLLGAPGSGKGTQAKIISKRTKWPILSTGEMLRSSIKNESDLGLKVKSYMSKGELVPDELVIELIQKRSQEDDCMGGFILDGFPRNIIQAKTLKLMLKNIGRSLSIVIYLDLDVSTALKRLTGRRLCKKCSMIFHIEYSKPRIDTMCDKCGGLLIQRNDDKEEVIKNRLDIFLEQTKPLVEYYEKKHKLKRINALKSENEISNDLFKLIKG